MGQNPKDGAYFCMEEVKLMTKQKGKMDKGYDLDNSFVHLLNTLYISYSFINLLSS